MKTLKHVEVVDERSDEEGWLKVRRRRLRNHYTDDSTSGVYLADAAWREGIDAVGVVAWRRATDPRPGLGGEPGVQVLLRECLRPGVMLRRELSGPDVTDLPPGPLPLLWEIAAGLPHDDEIDAEGLRRCGARELFEEMGIEVEADDLRPLGRAFYPSGGILTEMLHLFAVRLAHTAEPGLIPGDGTPFEEVGRVYWWSLAEALAACTDGRIVDAKTEIALWRLRSRL